MPAHHYSRLFVPKRAGDEVVLGVLCLHDPLGFEIAGEDLVAYFREATAARIAGDTLRARSVPHELTTDLSEGDPLEAYRANSRPFAVGRRLWIEPGESGSGAVPENRVVLRVPATRAFGTGSHASTRLALIALEDEPLAGQSVLDVGTGSGVLALAAVGLGASRAVGLDTDAEAVFVARENLRRHVFGERVGLYAGPLEACRGEFDIVVANMIAEEMLPEASRLLDRAGRAGRVVVSGVTEEREGEVLAALRRGPWKLAGRRTEGEWISLCVARAS